MQDQYIQKSAAFQYKSGEQSDNKNKNLVPFTLLSKIIKCLGINLTKELQNQFTESYKTALKAITEA